MEGEGAEDYGRQDTVDGADNEGGIRGEASGDEGNKGWRAGKEVREDEENHREGEVDCCYEKRIVYEGVHLGCKRLQVLKLGESMPIRLGLNMHVDERRNGPATEVKFAGA